MKSAEFVFETVYIFDKKSLDEVSELLIGKYIFFSIIKKENINREILAEKIIDYIEKLELKTGKLFDGYLKSYLDDIGSLVKNRVIDDSRAKQYFDLACSKIDSKSLKLEQIIDYTRIILCIYSDVIKNNYDDVSKFDLSLNNIDLNSILTSMESEETSEIDVVFVKWGSKRKFNTEEMYSSDTFTFMLVIILYYHLKNIEVMEE